MATNETSSGESDQTEDADMNLMFLLNYSFFVSEDVLNGIFKRALAFGSDL